MSVKLRARRTFRRRLVGEHFKQSGQPKRAFKSKNAAGAFLLATAQTECFYAYRCKFCDQWHLASTSARTR